MILTLTPSWALTRHTMMFENRQVPVPGPTFIDTSNCRCRTLEVVFPTECVYAWAPQTRDAAATSLAAEAVARATATAAAEAAAAAAAATTTGGTQLQASGTRAQVHVNAIR